MSRRYKQPEVISLSSSSSDEDDSESDVSMDESRSRSSPKPKPNPITKSKPIKRHNFDSDNSDSDGNDNDDESSDDLSSQVQVISSSPVKKSSSKFKIGSSSKSFLPPNGIRQRSTATTQRLASLKDKFTSSPSQRNVIQTNGNRFKEKFSYKPGTSKFSQDSRSSNHKSTPTQSPSSFSQTTRASSSMMKNYMTLKKVFPHLSQSVILSAIKSTDSLREASRRLKALPKSSTASPISRISKKGSSRSSRNNDERVKLTSSPTGSSESESESNSESESEDQDSEVEEVEEEDQAEPEIDVISSKVTLDKGNRLVDRYRKRGGTGGSPVKKRKLEDLVEDDDNPLVVSDDDEESRVSTGKKRSKLRRGVDPNVGYSAVVASRSSVRTRREKLPEVVSLSDSEDEPSVDLDEMDESEDDDSDYGSRRRRKKLKRSKAKQQKSKQVAEAAAAVSESEEDPFTDEDDDLDTEQRLLKFFNTADIPNLMDLATINLFLAEQIVAKRPFEYLDDIEETEFQIKNGNTITTSKPGRGRGHKTMGERIVINSLNKLKGYEAVDSLVRQCWSYGRSITKEVKKWGVSLNGDGVEIESVDSSKNASGSEHSESESDSDSDSPRNEVIPVPKMDGFDNMDDDDFAPESRRRNRNNNTKEVSATAFNSMNLKNNETGFFHKKPKGLAKDFNLKDYQQVGINWINLLYQKGLSCILADEMGLGKTLQIIAFLTHLKEKKQPGPHLIVVPSSTLENWLREFEKFSPKLYVRPYFGSVQEREDLREELVDDPDFDVLVTTYNLATISKYDMSFLRSRRFNVVVYDEGHVLKNAKSDRFMQLMKLKANYRVLLTGTPLQNNLRELVSLLSFILPNLFRDKNDDFEVIFNQKTTTRGSTKDKDEEPTDENDDQEKRINPLLSEQAIKKARTMMAPFVLRRRKEDVLKNLPPKHIHIVKCKMHPIQRKVYKRQFKEAKLLKQEMEKCAQMSAEELKKYKKKKDLPKQNNILMKVRKAAIHPLLFRTFYDNDKLRTMTREIMKAPRYLDANADYIYEDMEVMTDFELNGLCRSFPREMGAFYMDPSSYLKSDQVCEIGRFNAG
ncbi:unnamed protein product [Ambrosiozyma monospora]|uniref:DNA helicase n=1 Tax=Ambrosiozyma monospora TaxID=43982 RepID=A0A9W6YU68_AMBMO|nr:unnamed protein product [Ambrosiozyma monospora]